MAIANNSFEEIFTVDHAVHYCIEKVYTMPLASELYVKVYI